MAQTNFYKNFSSEDFINDPFFQNWILKDDDNAATEFWNNFLKSYPHKVAEVEEAKSALKKIPFHEIILEEAPTEEKISKSFREISKILGLKGQQRKGHVISIHSGWWVAASAIFLISLGVFFLRDKDNQQSAQSSSLHQHIKDVAPGGNKATLTLGNGETIVLDSAGNGTLSIEGGSAILKLADGRIVYKDSEGKTSQEVVYNTISTPPGGQYSLTLSDGSRVWLNAASSLRYPAAFTGENRTVELTGEGYFEVATDVQKPFRVAVNHTTIVVLGTSFNISAYREEDVLKTTLLEGKVRVVNGSQSLTIAPGQQAVVDHATDILSINTRTNTEAAVAWKNGLFQFDNTDIHNVMRQIGRWYDLEVVFDKDVPSKRFTGKIYRNVNVSEVFKILEILDIHFKLEGKKVIVTG